MADMKLACQRGRIWHLLRSPDYNLFPNSAVFESDFEQVTKKGECLNFTKRPTMVSMAVTSTEPSLPLPNVLLLAKVDDRGIGRGSSETTELSRLLPLRYVRLSVHDAAERILRLQMGTHKICYLRLHQKYPGAIFQMWSRLVQILQTGLSTTLKDPNIAIQHSLVPRCSSTSSSSTSKSDVPAAKKTPSRLLSSFC